LKITGASYASPMAIKAAGLGEIRTWLALLVKTFQLSDQEILSTIIDGEAAAVHWRARIRSKITGATVLTELVDVVRVRDGRIASYTEFFVPLGG
jgi:ketosteroid isomerase-like protein